MLMPTKRMIYIMDTRADDTARKLAEDYNFSTFVTQALLAYRAGTFTCDLS